jgi:hypothetical protein
MINQKAKYLLQKINDSLSEVKMRYRVTFEIDEEVEVNANATSEEIVEKAISQVVGHGGWYENDLTQLIKSEAYIEDVEDFDDEI